MPFNTLPLHTYRVKVPQDDFDLKYIRASSRREAALILRRYREEREEPIEVKELEEIPDGN